MKPSTQNHSQIPTSQDHQYLNQQYESLVSAPHVQVNQAAALALIKQQLGAQANLVMQSTLGSISHISELSPQAQHHLLRQQYLQVLSRMQSQAGFPSVKPFVSDFNQPVNQHDDQQFLSSSDVEKRLGFFRLTTQGHDQAFDDMVDVEPVCEFSPEHQKEEDKLTQKSPHLLPGNHFISDLVNLDRHDTQARYFPGQESSTQGFSQKINPELDSKALTSGPAFPETSEIPLHKYNSVFKGSEEADVKQLLTKSIGFQLACPGQGTNPIDHRNANTHEMTTQSIHSHQTPCGVDMRKMSIETESLEMGPQNEQSIQSEGNNFPAKGLMASSKSEYTPDQQDERILEDDLHLRPREHTKSIKLATRPDRSEGIKISEPIRQDPHMDIAMSSQPAPPARSPSQKSEKSRAPKQKKKAVVPPKMTTRSRNSTIKPSRFANADEDEESSVGFPKQNLARKVPRKTKDPNFKQKAAGPKASSKLPRKKSMDSGESDNGVRRQYKQFDFFFLRTCFRYMNEFFKETYSRFSCTAEAEKPKVGLKNLSNVSKQQMDDNLQTFISQQLCPGLFDSELTELQKLQVIQTMMVFLFSHRHTKDDLFIVETRDKVNEHPEQLHMDFTIVRDVMYHYSKKAQERFFSFPIETYLFVKFACSPEGQHFIEEKNEGKPDKIQRLKQDTRYLMKQALASLKGKFAEEADPLVGFLLGDLEEISRALKEDE